MKNQNEYQTSKDLFFQYQKAAWIELENYNYLKSKFPYQSFPKSAKSAWRLSVLAEFWRCLHLTLAGIKTDEKD